MYGWLWRHLGPNWVIRFVGATALTAGAVALLMYVVFPWADPKLPFNENTIDTPSNVSVAPSTTPTGTPTGAPTTPAPTATPTGPTSSISIPSGQLPGD